MIGRLCVSLILLTLLVPASILLHGVYLTGSDATATAGVSAMDQDGRDDADVDVDVTGDVRPDLSMMFFTEAAPNSNGIHYVCRRGVDTVAYFGESQVYYVVGDSLVRLCLAGSRAVVPRGEEPTGSVTNYLLGNDPALWRTGLVDCAVLRYSEIYPGVDMVYRIHHGTLKYEFVVAPHGDPTVIRMQYPDADSMEMGADSVTVTVDGTTLTDSGLYAYQTCEDCRKVDCSFNIIEYNTVGLSVREYDRSLTLTIDPTIMLAYSTFLGGSDYDGGLGIAVESGSVYVMGDTRSSDFPTVNAYDSSHNVNYDCFVTKFAVDGQSLVYSTFLGGSGNDYGRGIAVEDGYVYVTGYTESFDFITFNAYDSSLDGDYDCFVTKFAADGQSLVYSTLLGGSDKDYGWSIEVENDSVYVTGETLSTDFPTVNAYDSSHNGWYDCFVTKFAADGQSLVYSTLLGGSDYDRGRDIAVENGYAYVTGLTYSSNFPTVNAYDSGYNGNEDSFLTKFAINGSSLVYSTFIGGYSDDYVRSIAVENSSVYVTGDTYSSNFPTVNAYDSSHNGDVDCFLTRFAIDGQSLVYSTFIGGYSDDHGWNIAVEDGYVYVTGYTGSYDFSTFNAYDSRLDGNYDCFATVFTINGSTLVYSTLLGGYGDDYGWSSTVENGCLYITGTTDSSDFPTVHAYDSSLDGGLDCFMAILSADSDLDGLSDWEEERVYGTAPLDSDTDDDGLSDGQEINTILTDPLDSDTDDDGLSDGQEINTILTDPLSNDTDRDGIPDGWEVNNGFDPRDPFVPLNESLLYNAPLIGVLVVVGVVVVVLSIFVVRRRSGGGV